MTAEDRERVISGELLEVAEREMPCVCLDEYTGRGMFDPHCRCDDRDDAVAAAAAWEAERQRARRLVSAMFACRSEDCPQPFALHRITDVSGVSGTGSVAHGVQFADGQVVIRWLGETPSTVVWDSLDAAVKVHGHDGKTQVVWLAAPFSEMGKAEEEAAAAERERLAAQVGAYAEELGGLVAPDPAFNRAFVAGMKRAAEFIAKGPNPPMAAGVNGKESP